VRAALVPALVLLAGCNTVFGLAEIGPDAKAVDARVCDAGGAFGQGTAVPVEGIYSIEAAQFAPDLTRAYLSLCPDIMNKASCDLYQSTFDPDRLVFTQHIKMSVSTDNTYDSYPSVSRDGNYLLFASKRTTAMLQLWIVTKTNGSFDNSPVDPVLLLADQSTANEPYLLGDSQTLYFGANTQARSDYELYRATGGPPAFASTLEVVPGLSSTSSDHAPVVSDDELEVFFASNRPPATDLDLFTATRSSVADPFSNVSHLTLLSTDQGNDYPVWLSPDRCSLYYIGKVGEVATLYVSTR
jgi:predicted small secreted protein